MKLAERLAGVTLTPKLLGIVLLAWVLSLAALWGYMRGAQTGIAETARAEARQECAEQKADAAETAAAELAAAVAKARADWVKRQAELDTAAAADRDRIERQLAAQRNRADTLFRQLQAHIHAQPLPADCRLDPERVRLFNDARRGTAGAGPG